MKDSPAILVSGSAGYIGRALLQGTGGGRLSSSRLRQSFHRPSQLVTGSLVVGELLDKAMLARVFAQHDIVAVMHLAALRLVGESVVEPQKYFRNNVVGTLWLLDV
jgi:UDP-glucose 4-epimerase